MKKIINSGDRSFEPVLTDNLVLDDRPNLNSFNGITSDAVARAVAGASGEVPQVTESDNGKVLTAVYDEGGAGVEWGVAPSGLPDTTGASQGDVLAIGSSGPEWATPAAGGGFSPTLVAQRNSSSGSGGAAFNGYSLRTAALQPVSGGSETLSAGWYLVEFVLNYTERAYTWATGVLKAFDVKLFESDGPDDTVLTGTTMPLGMSEGSYKGYATAFLHLTSEHQLYGLKASFNAPEDANFSEMEGTVKIYSL